MAMFRGSDVAVGVVSGVLSVTALMYLCVQRKRFQARIKTISTTEAAAGEFA